MNIKVSIAIFILLSFFNIGAVSNSIISTNNSFNHLETNVGSISEFEENGVKLQYKTKDNIEKERSRIKEYVTHTINGTYKEDENNEFEIFNNDFNIDVKIWNEDKYNYVEIILINKNSQYTTADLKSLLKKLENGKLESIQYFLYYEGKLKNADNDYSTNKFIQENDLQKIRLLDINNGYAGTGYLSNKDKINFALTKYNTGSHIIIGTPIIFTTY
jgi:hypothetical protein